MQTGADKCAARAGLSCSKSDKSRMPASLSPRRVGVFYSMFSGACRCAWVLAQELLGFVGHARREPRHQETTVSRPIYLDYSATTPVDPRVAKKMVPFLFERFGNPASRSHAMAGTRRRRWRTRARTGRAAGRRGPEGNRLDFRRDRIEQPRHYRCRALSSRQGPAPDHDDDRAQGGARHDAAPGARGIRGHVPAATAERPARSGAFCRGDPPGHRARLRNARQ